jgi:hypothetical protein
LGGLCVYINLGNTSLTNPLQSRGTSMVEHHVERRTEKTATDARAGVTGHNVRYVLAASPLGVIVFFADCCTSELLKPAQSPFRSGFSRNRRGFALKEEDGGQLPTGEPFFLGRQARDVAVRQESVPQWLMLRRGCRRFTT